MWEQDPQFPLVLGLDVFLCQKAFAELYAERHILLYIFSYFILRSSRRQMQADVINHAHTYTGTIEQGSESSWRWSPAKPAGRLTVFIFITHTLIITDTQLGKKIYWWVNQYFKGACYPKIIMLKHFFGLLCCISPLCMCVYHHKRYSHCTFNQNTGPSTTNKYK